MDFGVEMFVVYSCVIKKICTVLLYFKVKYKSHMKYEKNFYVENIHRHDEMTPQGLEAHAIILEILILAQYVCIHYFIQYLYGGCFINSK
jgi:hypothetical protein